MRPESENRSHTILTAFFDDRAEAMRAVEDLARAGIARDHIRVLPERPAAASTSGGAYDHRRDEGGHWSALSGLSLPDEDRYAFAEGMSRGGVTLGIWAHDAAQAERAGDVIELHHGAVDMDERERSWRAGGWPGFEAGSASAGGEVERLPIAEERLHVGKRQVARGRVRVRVFVVEVPVEAQVTLREEHVEVERRPVGRVIGADEEARLLQERTIELEERGEEAVVEKVPVVKEELVLRRQAGERVETVRDTVRRTEVEVEDERAGDAGRRGADERR